MTGRSFLALAAVLGLGVLGLFLWSSRRETNRVAATEAELFAAPDASELGAVTDGLPEPGDGERAAAVLPRDGRLDTAAIEQPRDLPDDGFHVQVLEYPSDLPHAGASVNGFPADASGRVAVHFDPLPSGAMPVFAEATGHCSLSGKLQPGAIGSEPLVLRLPLLGRFEGIVRDERGVPLSGARLGFDEHYFAEPSSPGEVWSPSLPDPPRGWKYWGETSGSATCDAEGRFLSSDLFPSPRPYDVRVTPHDGAETKISPGHVRPGANVRLELVAPTVPMGTLQGTVTFDGKHVEGGVRWKCGERRGGARILITGDFEDRVPAGDVEVWATANQGRAASPRMRSFLVGDHATVTVGAGQTTRCDLAVEIRGSFGSIGGQVLREDGSPPPKLLVRLAESQGRFEQATYTDPEGRWREEVADLGSEYTVSCVLGGMPFELGTAPVGDVDLTFVLPTLGAFRIRVVDDETGKPIADWDAGLRRLVAGAGWGLVSAREFSETSSPELMTGEYELWVQASDGGYVPERVRVAARDDEANEPVEVRLRRALELDIELVSGTGVPPAESTIVLVEPEIWGEVHAGPDAEATFRLNGVSYGGGPLSPLTFSDRLVIFGDGKHARVSRLGPGEYRFKAFPPGLVIEPASVVLPREGPLAIRWRWE
jgi:hypothetical protein